MQALFKRPNLKRSASLSLLMLAALLLALLLRTPLADALALQASIQPEDVLTANSPCVSLSERDIGFDFLGYLPQADDTTMLAWRVTNPTGRALDAVGFISKGWTPLTPGEQSVYSGTLGSYNVRWALHNLIPSHEAFHLQPQGNWFKTGAQETFVLTVRNFDPQRQLFAWVRANLRLTQVHLKPSDDNCLLTPPAPSPTPTVTPTNTPVPVSPLPTPTPTPTPTPEDYTLPAESVVAPCVFTPPAGGIVEGPVIPLSAYTFSAPQVVLTNTAPIGIQQWLPDNETILVTLESLSNQLVSIDLVNTNNSDATEIVEPRAYLRNPMWLAANHTVIWQELGPFQNETFNISQPGYWLRSFDPPDEQRLSDNGRSGWSITHDVSPDGKQVVFMSLPGGSQPLIWNQESKTLRGLPTDLTNWRHSKHIDYPMQPFTPNWHPDGKKILFWDGTWVFLYDLTTDSGCEISLSTLTKRYHYIHAASWSPNGRYLLIKNADSPPYTSTAGPYDRVLVLDTYTGETVQYSLGKFVYSFSWAPDSQTVAMIGVTEQQIRLPDGEVVDGQGIYLFNVRNGEKQQVLSKYLAGGFPGLAWSPDGTRLTFNGAPLDKYGTGEHVGGLLVSQVTFNQ